MFRPIVLSTAFLTIALLSGCGTSSLASTVPAHTAPVHRTQESVLAIGGSVAQGRDAIHDDGYLQRAFAALSAHTTTTYHLHDEAIFGANSTQLGTSYKGSYSGWLREFHPQVVVISWGLINDALPKTPMPTFNYWLTHEIHLALAIHAKVLVVTPPVTEVAYTRFPTAIQNYVNDEIHYVSRLHNQNVRLFNIFNPMKAYISDHHQSYMLYVGDPNHPNTRGHILGGQILYSELISTLGKGPIRFTK